MAVVVAGGDVRPGDAFHQGYAHELLNELTYHADGQIRDEDYEFTAFLGSKMHGAGVRCMDCHDSHSSKTLLPPAVLCMKCHIAPTKEFPKAPIVVPGTHTFHKADSSGSQCVNCHMPQTVYMQRHPRHDHGCRDRSVRDIRKSVA